MEKNVNIILSSKSIPPLTIGMPVWNGETYIRRGIESHLNQDYSDFRFIISDNASTDATQEICNEYMKADKRIIYTRNDENIGSGNNHTKLVNMAEGSKYFMWAANDDFRDKYFVSKTMKELEENPNATLCCTEVNFIDLEGVDLPEFRYSNMALGLDNRGMDIYEKYQDLMNKACWCIIYGLFRYDAIKKVMPFPYIYSGDLILLFNFLLTGDIIKIPEPLFHYTYRTRSLEEYMEDMFPKKSKNPELKVFTRATHEIIKNIFRYDINIEEKVKLQEVFLNSIKTSSYWGNILQHENQSSSDFQDSIIRGIIYKDNTIKDIIKFFIKDNQIELSSNENTPVKINYEINAELDKIEKLIVNNDLSFANIALDGIINSHGNNVKILILKCMIFHKVGNFDNVYQNLVKSLDYVVNDNDMAQIISFANESLYFSMVLKNIELAIDYYKDVISHKSYLEYVKGLIKVENTEKLEKIYLSHLSDNEVTNIIKSFFIANSLQENIFKIKAHYKLSIIINIHENNFEIIDNIFESLENIELVILCPVENKQMIQDKYHNKKNILFIHSSNNKIEDLNKSIASSSGQYISIVDDIYFYKKECIDKFFQNINKIDESFLVVCIISDKGIEKKNINYSKEFVFNDLMYCNKFTFINKKAFRIYGMLSTNYESYLDEFIIRLSQLHLIKYIYLNNKIAGINSNHELEKIKLEYIEHFKKSRLVNKIFHQTFKNNNFNDINFYIKSDNKVEIEIPNSVYLILYNDLDINTLSKNEINQINCLYDQVWVSNQENYENYIKSGIDRSKIKVIPLSYSLKSYSIISGYINELKNTKIIRNNINNLKYEIKNTAVQYFNNKKFNLSEKYFEKLLNYNSFSSEVLYYLGLSQFHQNKYEEAIDSLSGCMELDFCNQEILEIMAKSLQSIGDNESAQAFYDKAKDLNYN